MRAIGVKLALVAAVFGVAAGVAVGSQPASRSAPPVKPEPARPASNGRTVDLRPKFVAGRLTRYELVMVSGNKVKSDEGTLDQDQTMTQTIGLSLRVRSVEDGTGAEGRGATVELVYDRMKMELETPDMRAVFDSAAPPPAATAPGKPGTGRRQPPPKVPAGGRTDPEMDELLAQMVRPMVGTTLTMKVDKDGNITGVSGGEALAGGGGLASVLAGLGGLGGAGAGGASGAPGVPVPAAGGGGPMAWMVSGPGQRGVVRVGESWTNTDTLGGTPVGGFRMVTRHTCRSVAEGGKVANLVFSGRADGASAGAPAPAAGGVELKDAAYGGDYAWDTVAGELKSMKSTMTTKLEGKVIGMGMKMSSETRVSVRRLP